MQLWLERSSLLIRASAKPYFFSPAYNLVCYANRDSSVFKEFYGLKDVQNLCRGSLRYDKSYLCHLSSNPSERYGGFCEVITAWKELGLLTDEPMEYLSRDAKPMTWIELTAKAAGSEANEA